MKKGDDNIGYRRRVWYPGATYHVMSRGVRGGQIFKEDSDYKLFMEIIKRYMDKLGFVIHSYCMMTNHFHLQLETKDVNISVIMEKILKAYANNFNAKYHFAGHVFQGSYKALLIEDPIYFLETSRYIHLNPVKARMVNRPEDYEYSSYRHYVGIQSEDILYKDRILNYFRDGNPYEYAKYVEAKMNHEEYENRIMIGLGEDDNWLPW